MSQSNQAPFQVSEPEQDPKPNMEELYDPFPDRVDYEATLLMADHEDENGLIK